MIWTPNPKEELPKEEDELPKDEWWEDLNDESFGRPLTEEEKQIIIDYLKKMLENKELSEETRQEYQAMLDQLKAELGKENLE